MTALQAESAHKVLSLVRLDPTPPPIPSLHVEAVSVGLIWPRQLCMHTGMLVGREVQTKTSAHEYKSC
jgi:hypothetical protein